MATNASSTGPLVKGPPTVHTVPQYARNDPRKRWWCSAPNCCASVTAKADLSRHYRERHPAFLDAQGKVQAAEMASWVNEQYLESGLATDEEKAAAAGGAVEVDDDDEEQEEETIENNGEDDEDGENDGEVDDDDDDGEDESESEDEIGDEVDNEDNEEIKDSEAHNEDDASSTASEASTYSEGPNHPELTYAQLRSRAAERHYHAQELLLDGQRVQSAACKAEADDYMARALVVRDLEEAGLREPWDFGPAADQAARDWAGYMANTTYGV